MMKKTLYIAAGALCLMLAGCSTHPKGCVTVNPEALVLTPDINNDMTLDVTLSIPPKYISKRSMAEIEPVLILGDEEVRRFKPIVVQGRIFNKKENRLMRLYGRDPHYQTSPYVVGKNNRALTVTMSEDIHLDSDFDSGRIVAYVTVDGCGQCYGTDTLQLAYLSNLSNLIDTDNMLLQWVDTVMPPTVKTFNGHGVARLQFEVNKWDILPELADNEQEMATMLRALTPVLKDSLSTLNSMSIFGSASAEGPYDKNVKLAQERANAAKEWLDGKLSLTPYQRRRIKVGSNPEGWEPVIAAMHAAGDADSVLVCRIVEKYPDLKSGKAEKEIRRLKCWPRIAENYLAKDRKVTYDYSWTIKSFETDREAMDMYHTRPDALNEPEFLRVAHMLDESGADDASMIDVYETLVRYIPTSEVGINNLAVLYYENGRYDDAIKLLQKQRSITDSMANTLALCYMELGDVDKAIETLGGLDTPKARYNLGTLLAGTHRMADAYPYLSDAADLNAAVAALGVNKNKEAWQILSGLDDDSAKADYVRAIALARLGDTHKAMQYLQMAARDADLKARAASEADFMPLRNNPVFNQIINQ